MVLAEGYVDGRAGTAWSEEEPSGFIAEVVEEDLLRQAAEDDHILGGFVVPMDGDHRSRLDGIEHPLGGVVRRVAKVEVLAQAGGGLGLGG